MDIFLDTRPCWRGRVAWVRKKLVRVNKFLASWSAQS